MLSRTSIKSTGTIRTIYTCSQPIHRPQRSMFQDTLFNARLKRRGDNIDLVEAQPDGQVVCPDFDPITQTDFAEEGPPPEGQLFVKTKYGQETCYEATQGTRTFVEDPITKTSWASPSDKAVLMAIPPFIDLTNLNDYGPNTRLFLSLTLSRVLEERFETREALDSNDVIAVYFSEGVIPRNGFRIRKNRIGGRWKVITSPNKDLEWMASINAGYDLQDPIVRSVANGAIRVETRIVYKGTEYAVGGMAQAIPPIITITNVSEYASMREYLTTSLSDCLEERFQTREALDLHSVIEIDFSDAPFLNWSRPNIRLVKNQTLGWRIVTGILPDFQALQVDNRYKVQYPSVRQVHDGVIKVENRIIDKETGTPTGHLPHVPFIFLPDSSDSSSSDDDESGSAANPIVLV